MGKYVTFSFLLGLLLLSSQLFAQNNIRQIELDVLNYVNDYRASRNLEPLERNPYMDEIAKKHSLDMANGTRKFSHNGFKKRAAAIRKLSTTSYTVGENLYYTTYPNEVGKNTVGGWITSVDHHKNLVSDYTYAGIGVVRNKRGRIYITMLYAKYE